MHDPAHVVPVFTGIAIGLILLSIPLILGRVPRNPWYGVRTQRTMHGSEAEWYAINRKGGFILFCISCVVLIVLSAVPHI